VADQIDLRAYVLLIVDKVDAAAEVGNRPEAARLLRLLAEVAREKAEEVDRG